jgi:hypothetical protein
MYANHHLHNELLDFLGKHDLGNVEAITHIYCHVILAYIGAGTAKKERK